MTTITETPNAIVVTRDMPADTMFDELPRGWEMWWASIRIDEYGDIEFTWRENLAFHITNHLCDTAKVIENVITGPEDDNCVTRALREYRPAIFANVTAEIDGDENTSLLITARHAIPASGLTLDQLADLAWDFFGQLNNITDPGTFNAPYLITSAARTLPDDATLTQVETALRALADLSCIYADDTDITQAALAMTKPTGEGTVTDDYDRNNMPSLFTRER